MALRVLYGYFTRIPSKRGSRRTFSGPHGLCVLPALPSMGKRHADRLKTKLFLSKCPAPSFDIQHRTQATGLLACLLACLLTYLLTHSHTHTYIYGTPPPPCTYHFPSCTSHRALYTVPTKSCFRQVLDRALLYSRKVAKPERSQNIEKPIKAAHRKPKALEKPIKVAHKEPKTLEKTNKNDTQRSPKHWKQQ